MTTSKISSTSGEETKRIYRTGTTANDIACRDVVIDFAVASAETLLTVEPAMDSAATQRS